MGFTHVLILVVVDNGLVLISLMLQTASHTVLILVVVDNGLVHGFERIVDHNTGTSLNPCCSGQWSRTNNIDYEDIYDNMS